MVITILFFDKFWALFFEGTFMTVLLDTYVNEFSTGWLTNFMPLFHLRTLENVRNTSFVMLSGGIEMEHYREPFLSFSSS